MCHEYPFLIFLCLVRPGQHKQLRSLLYFPCISVQHFFKKRKYYFFSEPFRLLSHDQDSPEFLCIRSLLVPFFWLVSFSCGAFWKVGKRLERQAK